MAWTMLISPSIEERTVRLVIDQPLIYESKMTMRRATPLLLHRDVKEKGKIKNHQCFYG